MSANIYAFSRYLSAELSASKSRKIHLGVLCKILIYLRTSASSADRSFFLSPNVHCPLKVHNFCFDFSRFIPFQSHLKPVAIPPLFHKEVLLSHASMLARTTVVSKLKLPYRSFSLRERLFQHDSSKGIDHERRLWS